MTKKQKQEILDNLIGDFDVKFSNSRYTSKGGYWEAQKLYDTAKAQGCKEFDFELCFMDFAECWEHFQDGRICAMAHHYKRAMATDLKHPVILSPVGGLLDGTHRILKALILGEETVRAIRLKEMPGPDGKDGGEE